MNDSMTAIVKAIKKFQRDASIKIKRIEYQEEYQQANCYDRYRYNSCGESPELQIAACLESVKKAAAKLGIDLHLIRR